MEVPVLGPGDICTGACGDGAGGIVRRVAATYCRFGPACSQREDKPWSWIYSTVTDLARFLGWSTSQPLLKAT